MPVKSTTPAACLVIEGNAVSTDQQIGMDLLTKTHPPTPSDLIAGIDRRGHALRHKQSLRTRQTPSHDFVALQHASWLAQRNSRSITLNEAQDPDRIWTQDPRSWKPQKSPRRTLPYPREF
jgi:hypothetical protein